MLLKSFIVAMLLVIAIGPARTEPVPLAYKRQVNLLVLKAARYPPAACPDRLQGIVVAEFTVNSRGRITSRRILKSSGHAILDQEALRTIDRVKAVPPFQPGWNQQSMNFQAPINFYQPTPCGPGAKSRAWINR